MDIDLAPFCATPASDPARVSLHAPFTHQGFTYATNGHVLVRVPQREDITAGRGELNVDRLLAILQPLWAGGAFAPLPPFETIPAPGRKPCPECGGLGRLKTCQECKGRGEIECFECGHERACPTCKGNRGVKASGGDTADRQCERCGGAGTIGPKGFDVARFAEHDFDIKYVELIRALPGLEVAFVSGASADAIIGLVFRFDGGVGALAQTRTRDRVAPTTEAA